MSDISLGHVVNGSSIIAGTTHTTGTFTPTAQGNFVLIAVNHAVTGGNTTDITSITGACISNSQRITSLQCGTGAVNHRLEIWAAATTASASAIVFTYPATRNGAVWAIQEFINVDRSRGWLGLIGGITANVASGSGVGGTGIIGMRKSQSPANMTISIWGLGSSDAITPRAGWTEIVDLASSGSPNGRLETQYSRGINETSATASFTSQGYAGAVIELWGIDGSGLWSAVETFTKTDGGSWGNDQNWDTVDGVPTTLSNQATTSSAVTYADGLFSNDSSSGNMEAKVSASTMALSGNSVVGLRVRGSPADTSAYEFLRVGATTLAGFTVILRKRIGSNYTTIAGPTTLARAALGTAEQLRLTVSGSTLTCYVNSVQVLAATDISLTATSRVRGGLVLRANVASDTLADNFILSDIGVLVGNSVTFAAFINTSDSATATPRQAKKFIGKGGTSNQAKAVLSSRFVRFTARGPTVSSARGTSLVTQVEGFHITRPLAAKAKTSSSLKGVLTSAQRHFAAKVPITSASGLTFHPVFLDVNKSQAGAKFPATSGLTVSLSRNVGETTKVFQADSATAHFAGGITSFAAKISNASNVSIRGIVEFQTTIPIVSGLTVTEWVPPFGSGGIFVCPINPGENPTTCAHRQPGDKLFRHYRPRPVGRNVYIWSDGTVSESDPDGYSHIWREADRTSDTLVHAAHVLRVFWGGHEGEQVSSAEATLLTLAGYTVRGFSLAVPLRGTVGAASGIRSELA